ncbi:MAG: hypothetical protein KKF88_05765 [Alphaproteobacteria bacterium]|nr:hypothetical protein [Alphaproteobacteria bacterium]
MTKGRIRLSLDFECGWGVAQGGDWRGVEAAGVYRDLRPALRRFAERLDELELSFTWAVVGGMVDEPGHRDVSHLRGGFARDMAVFLAEAEEPTVDGRDLLDIVTGLRTPQSFGTHTYTHLLFSDPEQGADVIAEDLARAGAVNRRLGLAATRLVFPRNHSGHLEKVAEAGITHARMPPVNAPDPTARPGPLQRAISLATRPIASVVETKDRTGVTLHFASELLNWGASASPVKRALIRRRRELAVEKAVGGEDIHFWIHPFDLVQTKGLGEEMRELLSTMASLRDRDLIEIGGF